MELVHICGPAKSPDKNGVPSISDAMFFDPDKKLWCAGDDDGETRVIVRFCPFCGLNLSTLSVHLIEREKVRTEAEAVLR